MSENLDAWHFIFDDAGGTWSWRRIAVTGEFLAESDFSFQSFNVCLADAARAGYLPRMPHRRVRSSDLVRPEQERRAHVRPERRRAIRQHAGRDPDLKIG